MIKSGREKFMNFIILLFGVALIFIAYYNNKSERNAFDDILNTLIDYNTVTVSLPSGSLEFKAQREDRRIAWEIFVQIRTRIAAVDFRENEDSLLHINKSLYELFSFIRDKILSLPLKTVTRDKNGNLVEFYLAILNDGIRPFLTKWHISVSHFHEKMKDSGKSAIEIDKEFLEKNPSILGDVKSLNQRMKKFASVLHRIAKGEEFTDRIDDGLQSPPVNTPTTNQTASESQPLNRPGNIASQTTPR